MLLAAYPEYKDSGHPFWGKIPAHWNLFRNGRLFAQRNETGFGELPILEVSLKTGVRVRDMDNLRRKQVMSDREKYKHAAQGDIAYNMMRMWQGAIGVAPVDGLVSPAYVVAKPYSEVDCRYFSYLFRTTSYMNEVDAYSRGIVKDRNRLYWQDFKRMPSVVPPLEEQRQIVRFLNDVGNKIQRFIRNKRRLIELLKEQKQNIINQAVTRGLDCNVKLKPSGVEWIGDIPEHWEVLPVRRCAQLVKTGGTPAGAGDEYFSTPGFNWFTPGDFKEDLCLSNSERQLSEIGKGCVKIFPPNTVMMIGIGGTIGKVAISKEMASCNQQINGILPNERVDIEYFAISLRCLKNFIVSCGKFTTMPIINQDETKSLRVPVPPVIEQETTVKHIKKESLAIDQAITRTQREIELIREYRTRLIADVVTGQVDVRGIEIPETVEEAFPETEDELDALDNLDDEATEDEA